MIRFEDAKIIAQREVDRQLAAQADRDDYEAVTPIYGETDAYWRFASSNQKMIDAGMIPGAIIVTVDKNNGHIQFA